jgi:hypothetical protein
VANDNAAQAAIETKSIKLSQGTWHIFLGDCAKQPDDSKKTITVTGTALPSIDSLSPSSASIGQSITITGSNLAGTTTVTFGGVEATPTAKQETKITIVVPKGAKSGAVAVTTPAGTTTKDGFKVVTSGAKAGASPKAPPTKDR